MDRRQFVIDSATALHAQGRYANSGTDCKYRMTDLQGCAKCAIGVLIPDALYDTGMEGRGVQAILRYYRSLKLHFESKYGPIGDMDIVFMTVVQSRLHDSRIDRIDDQGTGKPLATPSEAVWLLQEYL